MRSVALRGVDTPVNELEGCPGEQSRARLAFAGGGFVDDGQHQQTPGMVTLTRIVLLESFARSTSTSAQMPPA